MPLNPSAASHEIGTNRTTTRRRAAPCKCRAAGYCKFPERARSERDIEKEKDQEEAKEAKVIQNYEVDAGRDRAMGGDFRSRGREHERARARERGAHVLLVGLSE
jgi:hypothetical protein